MSYGWKYSPLGSTLPLDSAPGLPSGSGTVQQPIALPGIVVKPAAGVRSLPPLAWAAIALLGVKLLSSRG